MMIYKLSTIINDVRSRNIYSILKYVFKNPKKVSDYIIRTGSDKWIYDYFENKDEYYGYINEIKGSGQYNFAVQLLRDKFQNIKGKTIRGNNFVTGVMKENHIFNIYALIRKYYPTILIETGVCNGLSTTAILIALSKNQKGKLFSIDYPEYADNREYDEDIWIGKAGAVVPSDEKSGWLVPGDLKNKWQLTIGKSKKVLIPLLDQLGAIDFFIHDSEHSYENQLFEFEIAYKYLKSNGFLLASDINWSDAFDDFRNKINNLSKTYFVDNSLALIQKFNTYSIKT